MPASLRIGGFVPFTSIDYPGLLSAVLFVQGCPWACGYCHNPHLQPRGGTALRPWPDVLAWLRRRVGLIDGVVFSGGEPTVDPALPDAMADVRALGLRIGLHSAGIHARRLRAALPRTDWIGFDVKAPLEDETAYDRITGRRDSARQARDSLDAVLTSGVPCEVRTTAHPDWLDEASVLRLARGLAVRGVTRFALQLARSPAASPPADRRYPSAATREQLASLFGSFLIREG